MHRSLLASLLLCLPLAACNFYFSGGDDPDPCDYGQLEEPTEPDQQGIRNPESGVCEYLGGGGGRGCDDECGPCPGSFEQADPIPLPSWGYCQSECTGLDEQTCLATSECRGIYATDYAPGEQSPAAFLDCWQTDFSDSDPAVACESLDAWSCSTRDDCVATHENSCPSGSSDQEAPGAPQECGIDQFLQCYSEDTTQPPGCFSDQDCGEGASCNASEICLPPPDCDGQGACDAVCYGVCVPDEIDMGTCTPDAQNCMLPVAPPECPAGTTPGWGPEGCPTGYCIPQQDCAGFSCDSIDSEDDCIGVNSCVPVSIGVNCECVGDACTCEDWLFESCEAA